MIREWSIYDRCRLRGVGLGLLTTVFERQAYNLVAPTLTLQHCPFCSLLLPLFQAAVAQHLDGFNSDVVCFPAAMFIYFGKRRKAQWFSAISIDTPLDGHGVWLLAYPRDEGRVGDTHKAGVRTASRLSTLKSTDNSPALELRSCRSPEWAWRRVNRTNLRW